MADKTLDQMIMADEVVNDVLCPVCNAKPGELCDGLEGVHHFGRWRVFAETLHETHEKFMARPPR